MTGNEIASVPYHVPASPEERDYGPANNAASPSGEPVSAVPGDAVEDGLWRRGFREPAPAARDRAAIAAIQSARRRVRRC